MIYIDLILIAVIVCFIVDCSGIMTDFKKLAAKIIKRRTKISINPNEINIKPFTCSLCSVWWSGIIYLIIFNKFIIQYIAFVALLSLISANISGLLLTIKDYLAAFEMWLQKKINN